MKTTINKLINIIMTDKYLKSCLVIVFVLSANVLFAQGPHPGGEEGLPTPIDGGILMAILSGTGLVTMLFKKKKDKNKD